MVQVASHLGMCEPAVQEYIETLTANQIVSRIWAHDFTVWGSYPDEILNRLGWLDLTSTMQFSLPEIERLVQNILEDGIQQVVVLGMGGASLIAEVFQSVFGDTHVGIPVTILDSTHPDAISRLQKSLHLERTVFIFSMKKWALETFALYNHFYNAAASVVGEDKVGNYFIAITDEGAWVPVYAQQMGFREIILNNPYVGGRYAALTHVGLLPAILRGVDGNRLLSHAAQAQEKCRSEQISPVTNMGAWLGAVIGGCAVFGRDKLTLIADDSIAPFLTWLEQLIAESTGKDGTGILPVIEKSGYGFSVYGDDRLFILFENVKNEKDLQSQFEVLVTAEQSVIRLRLNGPYDLASLCVYWTFAVSVAGHLLGIQPFDQPNVEATKFETGRLLETYQREGRFPQLSEALKTPELTIFGRDKGENLSAILAAFLSQVHPGDYIALLAYLHPTAENSTILDQIKARLQSVTGCPVTIGYGPRYLHSTGQLHKGDAGRGHFIQITNQFMEDLPVPCVAGSEESNFSFGTLIQAQYMGDWYALEKTGRHIMRIHINSVDPGVLKKIPDFIK